MNNSLFKKSTFLEEIFIYFWVFSLFGHYLELIWKSLFFPSTWHPIVLTLLPLAPPYGLGVIMAILVIKPLMKRLKLKPLTTFVFCCLESGLVEYFCATIIVFFAGSNKFWNYSNQPFNINGYVCLKNIIIFGILNTFFLYFVYPFCQKIIERLRQHQISVIFWILFVSYTLDLMILELKTFSLL